MLFCEIDVHRQPFYAFCLMLTKILFTGIVIISVLLFFRIYNSRQIKANDVSDNIEKGNNKRLAYLLLAVLITLSGVIFSIYWYDQREIINIHVISSASGELVIYQAYKGKIAGRQFQTLDGRQITLSENDRIEMLVTD